MSSEAYSFWLVPEEPVERELGTLVRALAPVFGMPAFAPHATVQGDLDLAADEGRGLWRQVVPCRCARTRRRLVRGRVLHGPQDAR